jgi:hypothetical protein
LASILKQKLDVANKMVASQEAVKQRSIEAGEEAKNLEPKLKMIIAKTKELQGEVSCEQYDVTQDPRYLGSDIEDHHLLRCGTS